MNETREQQNRADGWAPELEQWVQNKFGSQFIGWGIDRYTSALRLPGSLLSVENPNAIWERFKAFDAASESDLIALFPRLESRHELMEKAVTDRESLKRTCFDCDYWFLSDKDYKKYPTSQAYWDARESIIKNAYEESLQHVYYNSPPYTLDQYRIAFYSSLAHNFIDGHLFNELTLKDIGFARKSYKGGFQKYLKEYMMYEEFLHPNHRHKRDDYVVHVLDRDNLNIALTTGRLGGNGIGRVCFSENRFCLARGFGLVFKLDELDKIYPLYKFDEDPYDAHILREWRSPLAVDINLAVALVPTTTEIFGKFPEPGPWGSMAYGFNMIKHIRKQNHRLKL